MKLELFQATVKEYKRFAQQLPIDYLNTLSGDLSEYTHVAAQTRLMLLRKYTRTGRGDLYLADIANEAICRFPENSDYFSEFKTRFQDACDQSLKRTLADGTERTLDECIDDTMYGFHLHADEERIHRIAQDNELLRMYCVVTFVKEVEALVIELSGFLEINGVMGIDKENHLRAPVIHLESNDVNIQNVTGSPYWSNLIGTDITEENVIIEGFEQYTFEEWQLWKTACAFTQLLEQERFLYDEMRHLVFESTISDWGDFSEAVAYYRAIQRPGMSTKIRYSEQRNVAYINVYPYVEEAFIVDSPQIVSNVYIVTLVKDQSLGEWRVFAFGGHVDPFILD